MLAFIKEHELFMPNTSKYVVFNNPNGAASGLPVTGLDTVQNSGIVQISRYGILLAGRALGDKKGTLTHAVRELLVSGQ